MSPRVTCRFAARLLREEDPAVRAGQSAQGAGEVGAVSIGQPQDHAGPGGRCRVVGGGGESARVGEPDRDRGPYSVGGAHQVEDTAWGSGGLDLHLPVHDDAADGAIGHRTLRGGEEDADAGE